MSNFCLTVWLLSGFTFLVFSFFHLFFGLKAQNESFHFAGGHLTVDDFADNGNGTISVIMTKHDEEIQLTLKDDGIGFSGAGQIKEADTMGLTIVRLLVDDQLEGSIECNGSNGTTYNIRFPVS